MASGPIGPTLTANNSKMKGMKKPSSLAPRVKGGAIAVSERVLDVTRFNS